MKILVLNCGSSSFKYQLIDMDNTEVLCSGLVERIGDAMGGLTYKSYPGTDKEHKLSEEHPFPDHTAGMERVMQLITHAGRGVIKDLKEIAACGHRVVQGGESFTKSCVIGAKELQAIRDCVPLAPLHNPANIQGVEVAQKLLPHAPSVAVFDTEFHTTMPPKAYMYPLPYEMYEKHRVRRYGAHGTSHRYVAQEAAKMLGKAEKDVNVITCHLGNGGSISAVQGGVCVDTSMGLTPLAGVMMGTRSGDIDPAILPFLGRHTGMTLEQLDNMLNRQSGLKGICGMNDMRDIHAAREKGDKKAELAFAMFVHTIRRFVGAYYAVLGRVDALVFTAGIGENDPALRAAVCADLENMGIELDQAVNATRSPDARNISKPGTRVPVLVIPTNEELAIAQATMALVK